MVAPSRPAETARPELIERVFGLACEIRTHPRAGCPLLIPLAGDGHRSRRTRKRA